MTDASTGLRKALGRSASGEVIALAEMTAEDLIASLSDEQRASLAAALPAPAATAAEPSASAEAKPEDQCSEDGDDDDENGDSDPKMGKKKKAASDDTAANAASDRVKIVAAAVANDDACKGKAALALAMLADDDYAGLNGAAMVKIIAKTPSDSASAASADVEEAARAEMRAALSETANSNIDASGAGTSPVSNAQSIWDKAIAANNPGLKQN